MKRERVVVGVVSIMLASACGGLSDVPKGDASSEASASGCPSNAALSSAVGTACTNEGLSCGGDQCKDACSFCNIIRCTGGTWTQQEAFPDPNCNDATACSYPPVNNDPQCPQTYSSSYEAQPCAHVGLACAYPGAGDEVNGCYATAMMWCNGDGGTGTWTVAQ